MKLKLLIAVSAVLFSFLLSLAPLSAKAFDMSEYWPLKPGTVWILDYETLIVRTATHQFEHYEGTQFIIGSTYCTGLCGQHVYVYSGPEGILAVGIYEEGNLIDLSATPLKIANKEMDINDEFSSTVPPGVLDENDAITLTVKLLGQEDVTVPMGTFENTLVLRLTMDDDPDSHYIEKLWLAKNVGPVKIERVSESPLNHEGCFLTCGCFDWENENDPIIVQRVISLEEVFGPWLIDIHNDGRLGLEEAIFTLQVLSGER